MLGSSAPHGSSGVWDVGVPGVSFVTAGRNVLFSGRFLCAHWGWDGMVSVLQGSLCSVQEGTASKMRYLCLSKPWVWL